MLNKSRDTRLPTRSQMYTQSIVLVSQSVVLYRWRGVHGTDVIGDRHQTISSFGTDGTRLGHGDSGTRMRRPSTMLLCAGGCCARQILMLVFFDQELKL